MILTLPVSHLITRQNFSLVPGIRVLEYKNTARKLDVGMEAIFHSNKGIIENDFPNYFEKINGFLQENEIGMFSFDLGPACRKLEYETFYFYPENEELSDAQRKQTIRHFLPGDKVLSRRELEKLIKDRLNHVRSIYPGEIALENLDYFSSPAYAVVCEPDFISEVIRKNKVYFVLDIAHALVSAHNMGISEDDYFSALPLERVREIHLSAAGPVNGEWKDMHGPPSSKEYNLLLSLKDKIAENTFVVVEYYRGFPALIKSYERLAELC
jgi:Protein of unknown function (DUF692)